MFDLCRRGTLHRGTGVAGSDDNDFGGRASKIMFKSCQTECDRRPPPHSVTVTVNHVHLRNALSASQIAGRVFDGGANVL
jgi:hypothetical protein